MSFEHAVVVDYRWAFGTALPSVYLLISWHI